MAPSVIINGREIEELNPYLSRDGVALLWLVSQHLGAQVSWRERDDSMVISGPGSLNRICSWVKGQLGMRSSADVPSRGPVPPPVRLLASVSSTAGGGDPRRLPRVDGGSGPFEKEVGDVQAEEKRECDGEGQKNCGCDPGDDQPADEPDRRGKKHYRSRTDSVVHHRSSFQNERGSGEKRPGVTESRSSGGRLREKLDLLARYRPG